LGFLRVGFNADPDPAAYIDADPDPDLWNQTNADPDLDPVQASKSRKVEFLHKNISLKIGQKTYLRR
jgi:hypothetical protein